MVVWSGFAVPMHICRFSLLFHYPNKNHTSIDSPKKVLYNDINYVNVDNKIITVGQASETGTSGHLT